MANNGKLNIAVAQKAIPEFIAYYVYLFFNPISLNLSSRYSPAVASSYALGCPLSIQLSRHRKLILVLDAKRKELKPRCMPQFPCRINTLCVVLLMFIICKALKHVSNIYYDLLWKRCYTNPFILFGSICSPSAEALLIML